MKDEDSPRVTVMVYSVHFIGMDGVLVRSRLR